MTTIDDRDDGYDEPGVGPESERPDPGDPYGRGLPRRRLAEPQGLPQGRARAYDDDGPLHGVAAEDVPAEQEAERHVLHGDRFARTERMIWRNVFLGLYVFGVLLYTFWALTMTGIGWNLSAFVVLALGGIVPGLWFAARESNEREIEWNRARPEPRAGDLPGLRRPADQYSADYDR